MIQCSECEYFVRGPGGQLGFRCDPFSTIKEPECLLKWQLLKVDQAGQKLDRLVAAYEATLEFYKRLAPLQEKMMRHMEREIEELEEGESWKYGYVEDEQDDEDEQEPQPGSR